MGSCLSGDGSRDGDARGGQTSDNERGRQQDQRSDESTVRPPPPPPRSPSCIHGMLFINLAACWRGKNRGVLYTLVLLLFNYQP